MNRDLLTMLDYEADRNPTLAALVADIALLSEDEIRSTPVKLPWIRRALLLLKQRTAATALAHDIEQWLVDGRSADPSGEMRRWEGGNTYIRVGSSSLEIRPGEVVWFGTTGVWIDTIFAPVIDPLLWRHTISCGRVRRSEYMAAVRNRTRNLMPEETRTPESAERWQIFRPPCDVR